MQHFSKEVGEKAKNVNLVEFLQARGEKLKKEGKNYRLIMHDGNDRLLINGTNNLWIWNLEDITGKNAVDFLMKIDHMTYSDAIYALIGKVTELPSYHHKYSTTQENEPFILPNKSMVTNEDGNQVESFKQAFAYLWKSRCILPEVINHFHKVGDLYEDAEHHNAVFIGRDEKGIPRYANKRSTNTFIPDKAEDGKKLNNRWDVKGSDKNYGFCHVGTSDRLFVFEAAIDMMSYISLRIIRSNSEDAGWKADSYVCLGCRSDGALRNFLKNHQSIRRIVFCLDNDLDGHHKDGTPMNWGQKSADKYMKIYGEQGYKTQKHVPAYGKDFNDMLKVYVQNKINKKTGRK